MKDTGRRTFDGRKIAEISPEGVGPLYRVSYGNGRPVPLGDPRRDVDGLDPSLLGCNWDGDNPGRVFAYFDTVEDAVRDGDSPGEVYCGIHCWGQTTGYTYL